MDDVWNELCETLGIEVDPDTLRECAFWPWRVYTDPDKLDELARVVWAEETGGAEWPWGER